MNQPEELGRTASPKQLPAAQARTFANHVSADGPAGIERVVADQAAFEGFYRENVTRVVRACALVTLDRTTAEDISAESFARLWAHWGQIHDEDHAGGYVFKTAMRLCSKQGTKARREILG